MPDSYITPEMLDSVGRVLRSATSFPITDSDIRRWAIAVYYPEPPPRLFWDAEYAAGTVHGGIVAPEEFNPMAWLTRTEAQGGEMPSGTGSFILPEAALGIASPAISAVLNGGTEADYGVRMRPGDVITSTMTLGEYKERRGRLGLMLFTTVVDTWTNQRSETVKTSRGTLIRY
jgi:hypothetical protein